jgi:hypothetical protein
MNAPKPVSASVRGLYLSIVAAFGFFLAASAPHRVHHFFEQFPAAEHSVAAEQTHDHTDTTEHSHSDHHKRPTSKPADCFVLSVAQNAHASLVQTFAFVAVEHAVTHQVDPAITEASSFNPSPFSQRAPPLI